MKKKLLGSIIATLVLVGSARADDTRATPADAQALVKNAVAYMQRHGPEKAFKEFGNRNGQFIYRDLYVVVLDMKGIVLAHGEDPAKVGKNLMDLKDPDGKAYVRERIAMAQKAPTGSHEFKRKNPDTGKLEMRNFVFERVGDYIVGSGSFTKLLD
jgi:cytochrome c